MLRFLDDESILSSAVDLIAEGERADLAIAYWGDGAIKLLEIDHSKPVRIICDLMGGGSNPKEIGKLLEKDNVRVKHLSDFHAKVFWTPTSVIVGSANASTNGLGNTRTFGTIEAALQTDDGTVLDDVQEWFKRLWRRADTVTDALISQATATWDPFTSRDTVLGLLRSKGSRFQQHVSLVYIDEPAEQPALEKFRSVAENYYTPAQLSRYEDGDGPFFQAGRSTDEVEKDCKPGDYIINCAYKDTPVSRIRVPGAIKISDDDCIVLVDDGLRNLGRLRFPKEERTLLYRAVQSYMKRFRTTEDEFKRAKEDFACFIEQMPGELLFLINEDVTHSAPVST
jgi:hypothetical protein